MAIELLQHALERFGVVTVMDATIYDIVTAKPTMFLDTLKISNITSEGQQKEIKGGKYADTLLVYNFARAANIEFQDALLSFPTMKALWGAELTSTPADIVEHVKETFTAGATLTLAANALAIEGVVKNVAGVNNDAYLTLGTATPSEGQYYWVSTTANQIKLNAAETGSITIYYTKVAPTPSTGDWRQSKL